jgi:hypothetical protein
MSGIHVLLYENSTNNNALLANKGTCILERVPPQPHPHSKEARCTFAPENLQDKNRGKQSQLAVQGTPQSAW